MTLGDKLIGRKTIYKGIEFKSSLETKFAYIFDKLNIKYEYEPKNFRLSNNIWYVPDFYLPELKIWIEVKGKIEEHNKKISEVFVKDNNTVLLLISQTQQFWFSNNDGMFNKCDDKFFEDNCMNIGKCSYCNSFFLTSSAGSYACTKCDNYDGDHDLIIYVNEADSLFELLNYCCKNDKIDRMRN